MRQAIVLGNGPGVLALTREVVEAHEVIVRCNGFVLDQFEDKIGERTDVYCVHADETDKWYWEGPVEGKPIIWFVAGNVVRTRRSPPDIGIPGAQWFLPEELLVAKLQMGLTGPLFPTTGALALWRATRRFKLPVGYAGFSDYDRGFRYYWDSKTEHPAPPMHSSRLEQAWMRRLESEGVLENLAAETVAA